MNKTIEQLKQEADAATAAVRAAEEAARAQEREAKEKLAQARRAEAHKEEYTRRLEICNAIVAAARAKGLGEAQVRVVEQQDHPNLLPTVKSTLRGGDVHIEQERSSSGGWLSHPTGKLYITVGDYGDKARFPQRKDGSFSYDKIAERLAMFHAREQNTKKAAEERAAQVNANADLVNGLCKEFDLAPESSTVVATYESVHYDRQGQQRSHQNVAPVGKVYLRLGTSLVTEDQAHIMLAALKRAGLLKLKEAK